MNATYVTELAKEDFKFSCAHFTVFGSDEAEPLHGHNYRVAVLLAGPSVDGLEFLVEFGAVKGKIRELCDGLDEAVLLPAHSELVVLEQVAAEVEVRFGDRSYRLPQSECRLLPVRNITVEALARHLWSEIAPVLEGSRVTRLGVRVGETAGQSSRYEADLVEPGGGQS